MRRAGRRLTTWSGSRPQRSASASGRMRATSWAGPRARCSPSRSTTVGVDALLDQPVQQPLQPLPSRSRHRGRLLERIDAWREAPRMALALDGGVDPPIDALQALAAG